MLTDPRPALGLVVDLLRAAEFEVDLDPAKVNPGAVTDEVDPELVTVTPAAWVKWPGQAGPLVLDGSELVWIEVYCLAPDMPYPDALGAMLDIGAKVVAVLGDPDGTTRVQTSKFGDGRELPSLVLPYLVENPPAE